MKLISLEGNKENNNEVGMESRKWIGKFMWKERT